MLLSSPNRSLSSILKTLFVFWFSVLPLIYSYRFYNRGAISSFAYNPYELPKFLWFVLGAWLLGIGQLLKSKKSSKPALVLDRLTIFILLYISIVFVSNLFGLDSRTSILGSYWRHQGWLTLASGILLFLTVRLQRLDRLPTHDPGSKLYLQSGKKRKKQVWVSQNMVGISAFLVSTFACWQGIRYHLFQDLTVPTYHGRIVGTMGNPNFLGGWLAMSLPLVLGAGRLTKCRTLNISMKLILSLMIALAILLSGSRSAWLAVGIVGSAWLLTKKKTEKASKKKAKLLAAVSVSFVLISTFAFFHLRGGIPFTPWVIRYSIWENRLIIWQEGMKAVVKRPILGYGQENFALAFPAEKHLSVDNAHNLFLEILISSGVFGLLVFLAILVEAFKRLPSPAQFSLLAFLIRAQFNPLSIPEIALFWYVLALCR